jgi:hypothetical protein
VSDLGVAPQTAAELLGAFGLPTDPVTVVPTLSPAVSGQVVGMAGALQGWSLRESGASAGSNQEKSSSTALGAAITVALSDTAGEQTYVTGFDIDLGIGAAVATVQATLTGLANALAYDVSCSTTGPGTLSVRFPSPLPGAAITLSLPAIGGAAAANSITIYGTDSASTQAIVEFWDGEGVGGVLLACASIPAGGSSSQSLLAGTLPFRGGLYLNVVSGTCKGAVYVRV